MIDKLRDLPLFRSFDDEALAALSSRVTAKSIDEGEVLFEEGEEGETFYIVDAGEVTIRKKERTLAVLRDGQMFGEMALFEKETRSASAVATRETSLYAIGNEDFLAFLLEHPGSGTRFLFETVQEMSCRLRQTSEYLTTVFETGRIVGGGLDLQEMAERILRRLLDDVGDAAGGTIALYNAIVESYEITSRLGQATLDLDRVVSLANRHSGESVFQETEPAALLGVALTEDGGTAGQKDPKAPKETVLGYILLEKQHGDASPFSAQEEIVVAAVGQQTGLGILHAYDRQDEEARERLERNRMRWR